MLGTDLPFDMADARFREHLPASAFALAPVTRVAVTSGNATALFGLNECRGRA